MFLRSLRLDRRPIARTLLLSKARMKTWSYRPQLEMFEHRVLPTTCVVGSIADSGMGTLRDAITQANANTGLDTIRFNLRRSGTQTIHLLSALPPITVALILVGS